MCGIAGIWHLDKEPLKPSKLQRFTDSLYHRGPDGAGYNVFEDVALGLGHRRLSILDLSEGGKQPMSYANQRYWITYNGEVYNFLEIKKELEALGHTFHTTSDTEVILASYVQWGKNCLDRFNGMWAFAIYDSTEKDLFLARDRFGIKPLHYHYSPGKLFAFASETLAFRHLDDHTVKPDTELFIYSLNNSSLLEPTGKSIYEGILQLKAGHFAVLSATGSLKTERWWNTSEHLSEVPKNYEEQVEKFRELFFDSCKLRLRSDVTIASALSGGIDSSSVFCTVNHLASHSYSNERLPANWQQAYSISFPGTSVDEAQYVKIIRDELHAQVNIITPDHGALVKNIINTTRQFDAITGTPIISLTDVYKAMHDNKVVVSLDGHGGDEMLYGYSSSVYKALWDSFVNDSAGKEELAEAYLSLTKEAISESDKREVLTKLDSYTAGEKRSFKNSLKRLIGSNKNTSSTAERYSDWFFDKAAYSNGVNTDKLPGQWTEAESFLYKEFHQTELPYNLRDFDRASMQSSIEVRMPLMDYRLVAYCFSLPLSSKLGKGYTKRILRDAMKNIVPRQILERRTKIGLGAPTKDWFNGPLNEFITDTVRSKAFLGSPYWNGKLISEFVLTRCKEKNWNNTDAVKFWRVLNGHLLLN